MALSKVDIHLTSVPFLPMTHKKSAASIAAFSILAAGAFVALSAGASAATVYSTPGAPVAVTAEPAAGGVQVRWSVPVSTGNLPVTQYIVDGGQGSCPITVAGNTFSAFVPAIAGQTSRSFSVTAANAEGFGSASAPSAAVAPIAATLPTGVLAVGARGVLTSAGGAATFPLKLSAVDRPMAGLRTPSGNGAIILTSTGVIRSFGDASSKPISLGTVPAALVRGFNNDGYYAVGRGGIIVAGGGAPTIASVKLRNPSAIGAVAIRDNAGLWIVTATGQIIGAGSASAGQLPKDRYTAVIGRATGEGFWAITREGQVRSYGDAPAIVGNTDFLATARNFDLDSTGKGFYALGADGSIRAFGGASSIVGASAPGSAVVMAPAPQPDFTDAQILALSDLHGALDYTKSTANGTDTYTGGVAALAANFDRDRQANPATFTVSSGDNWGAAPPLSTAFDEFPTVYAMNIAKFDTSIFGNHEHDKDLAHAKARVNASTFKWVISNYSSLNEVQAKNANNEDVTSWTIVNRGGIKLGVVGLNVPETKETVFPGNLGNISIGDLLDSNSAQAAKVRTQVKAAIQAARNAGADVVITTAHEGYGLMDANSGLPQGRLIDIAPLLEGSDALFGGHSHLKFGAYVGNKLVAETVNAGVFYNRAHLCVDRTTRRTVGMNLQQPLNIWTAPAGTTLGSTGLNADEISSINNYKSQLNSVYNNVIGSISAVAPNGGNPQVQRQRETALGDYLADIQRKAYGTDIALQNGGGIRDMLPAKTWVPSGVARPTWASAASATPWAVTSSGPYPLTYGDVATVLPFGNQAVTTTITGADVWAALENGVSQLTAGAGRFPQVSGLKFTFNANAAVGSRVSSVTLTNGTPVPNSSSVSYSLATNDFMVAGGDGYTMLGGIGKAKTREVLETLVRNAIIEDSKNGPLVISTDGRITRIN